MESVRQRKCFTLFLLGKKFSFDNSGYLFSYCKKSKTAKLCSEIMVLKAGTKGRNRQILRRIQTLKCINMRIGENDRILDFYQFINRLFGYFHIKQHVL